MGSNSCGKIRIIAKIRAFTDVEAASGVLPERWVSVHKPNGESSKNVKISFGDQLSSRKESYDLDYCYEQDEDNSLIYSREIKPLISEVFDGCNVSVIAFGARGSGKTHTIQGSDETPGLAALAVAEILSMAEKAGKLISISSYEVYQDHVYDLLDPKRPEVMALEDARGKIQLKGLSQVPVNSILEFNKLLCNGNSFQKPQKTMAGLARRSHKGLILHVLSPNESSDYLVSKMNFVDLAGYEDPRRKSNDRFSLVDINRINKSIYALQNVIYALNANESHVPYRESKLSRMLQDSLVGTNQTIMISCLNPSFCQDTMYMVSLASRSCQGINRAFANSTKKAKSSARSMVPLSKIMKSGIGFTNKIKQNSSQVHFSAKKASGTTLEMMGRKLFEEGNHLGSPDQENTNSDVITDSTVPAEEENTNSDVINDSTVPAEENSSFSIAPRDVGATLVAENETSGLAAPCILKSSIRNDDITAHTEHNFLELVTPRIGVSSKPWTIFGEGHDLEKENKSLYMDEGGSPPISARLREISNNLKSLCSSTPLCLKLPLENRMSVHEQISDSLEPKTPDCEQTVRADENREISNNSPDESFNMRSAGMKKSIVEEYVKFLNTASKDKLKEIKGIGEKRATYILALREESPEPFKDLDDLKDIGLSAKQIKGMMKKVAGDLFS